MRMSETPIIKIMEPVTTGGKSASRKLTSGATMMVKRPAAIAAPKMVVRRTSGSPIASSPAIASMGPTAAKVTPIITGSRMPKSGVTPTDWMMVTRPQVNRSALTRRATCCGESLISAQTVGNVLRRHALPPAPERKRTTTWPTFIRTHLALLGASDFFAAGVLTVRGLVTYYVLFFIHLDSRRVDIAGITIHPDEPWMKQIARNATMEGCGILRDCRYLLHDRGTKYTQAFRAIIASGQVKPLLLPACSPNLNAYAERWVRSVKEECLSKVILFGERSLRRALSEYVEHYHTERNHQGRENVLLFPRDTDAHREAPVRCRQRLGGLLRYYHQAAA